ncbi:hypothetical protein JTB14_034312 [Gonioctena quinquepunctata]|nr:hypothetical protein JTB14_034312 [Gonioctena quinquepunctata]
MKWSLSQSAPAIVRKNNKYSTKPPWWDDECLEAIKKRKEAFRKFKDISDERNFIEIKKEIARSRRIYKKEKKVISRFFRDAIRESDISMVWKK